jgi:hypothetical protein
MVTPEFVAIGWKYLRRYFRLAESYIAERRNGLPAISWKPARRIERPGVAFQRPVQARGNTTTPFSHIDGLATLDELAWGCSRGELHRTGTRTDWKRDW